MIQSIGKRSNPAFETKQKKYSDSAEYASRKNKKVRTICRLPSWEKKKSSHSTEKNYKYIKLNWKKVSALPTKEGRKKTKNKCGQ